MEEDLMRLETKRLYLRNFEEKDFQDLLEYLSNPEVVKFEPYRAMNEQEVRENLAWRIATDEMIAMEEKETGKLIGNVYLGNRDFESKELGYVLNQSVWGKGYAKEACKAVIADAFSNGIHRVFAECDPENVSSWKLLEALGFTREAYFKENVYFWKDEDGKPIWKDTYVYSLLQSKVN